MTAQERNLHHHKSIQLHLKPATVIITGLQCWVMNAEIIMNYAGFSIPGHRGTTAGVALYSIGGGGGDVLSKDIVTPSPRISAPINGFIIYNS